MNNRILYFGNGAYLKTANKQLIIQLAEKEKIIKRSIEDISIVIVDHPQITITQTLLIKLLENNVAFITCDNTHHPIGLMLNLNGHSLQSQKFKYQLEAPISLKKQLWQQTIIAKLINQAALLSILQKDNKYLLNLAKQVKSADRTNCEAKGASYYWKNLMPDLLEFRRDRMGPPPNNLLNYGYAILRAIVARSLVGCGLLPTLGIFHKNQYNAYCLADDIMEPYRPYVDWIVYQIITTHENFANLNVEIKKELLALSLMKVQINNYSTDLINAVQITTSTLINCFEEKTKKLLYPTLS